MEMLPNLDPQDMLLEDKDGAVDSQGPQERTFRESFGTWCPLPPRWSMVTFDSKLSICFHRLDLKELHVEPHMEAKHLEGGDGSQYIFQYKKSVSKSQNFSFQFVGALDRTG